MKETNDVIALVIDHGLFTHIALACARGMKKVYYWSPWDIAFPKIQEAIVGDGYTEIERVLDYWDVIGDIDLAVFPDVGYAGLQRELVGRGIPVWGHHGGDELETNRGLFLRKLEELEMPVGKYEVLEGLDNLRSYLYEHEDVWVKISRWRGNIETFHWTTRAEGEQELDGMAYKLGPAKNLFRFYVFDPIEADVEDGIDAYNIDGQWPGLVFHGMEKKDKALLGCIQPLSEISPLVRNANELFGPVLANYGYRGFFSTEVRIKDDEGYFTDPTCRAPSPPSQVVVEIFDNFPDIIWQGANGFCIDPVPAAKYGVQALVKVERDEGEWESFELPDDLRQWFKPLYGCQIDGRIVLPPSQLPAHYGGWLVALGDTIPGAIKQLKDYRDDLPSGVDCDISGLADLLVEAQAAKEEGIKLGNGRLPDPAIVIDKP